MRKALTRAASTIYPPEPNSGHELANFLDKGEDVRFTKSDGEPFYIGTVHFDGQTHVAFANHELLMSEANGQKLTLHLDGTFKPIPGFFSQLLVVHVVVSNRVSTITVYPPVPTLTHGGGGSDSPRMFNKRHNILSSI